MAWRLNDSEREAFNYLIGGVVVVLALRGLFWAGDTVLAPTGEDRLLLPFRQGYFLMDAQTTVPTDTGRTERLALACVLAAGAALVVAAIGFAAKCARRPTLRWARVVLVTVLVWCLGTALFMPLRAVRVHERALVITEHRVLLGQVPLPFTRSERSIPSEAVDRIEVVEEGAPDDGNGTLRLQAVLEDGTVEPLGSALGKAPLSLERLRKASEAAMLLEGRLR